ncbi:hypothetical protein [Flavivirga spongiicola]|uniref:Uncharacterized protein n=1 Tax=Flavivirga spongiicola TaxID=421621 RepID=A0ABU7XYI1_9FLAO|nr:hypothetical protein [Flavivirga sp. MEBiC05379]MDO5980508.1 hypothetical protein [Flavivirga sp. MEBiC05379]
MKRVKSDSQNNNINKKDLILGSVIATLVAITPYLFDLYQSVPDIKIWNTFLFNYESTHYESVRTVAWTLTNKLVPLLLIFLWFFTCRHWWYHALLVPIAMYFYQIIMTFNDDIEYLDSNHIMYLIPVMAIVIPTIYLIRARIFNSLSEVNKSMQELEDEFKMSPKNFWGKVKNYF